MGSKLSLLAGVGVGYILGTRAGRERYERMRSAAIKVKEDPRVQEKTHQAVDLAKSTAHQAADMARDKAPAASEKISGLASTVAHKVRTSPNGTSDDEAGPEAPAGP